MQLESAGSAARALPVTALMQDALGHHEAGRLVEAESLYRQVLQAEPNHADALHYLGVMALQTGKFDLAVEFISKALDAQPTNPLYLNNLGNALKEQRKLDEAVANYRKALALKPDYAMVHSNLGIALKELGRLDEAIASYRAALSIKPDYVRVHNSLGIALQEQGSPDAAIASYRMALSFKADDAMAYNNLGVVHKEQGRLDEAIASYRQALAFSPNDAETHNNLGNVLKEQGQLDEAVVSLRVALALKPDHAMANNNLANTLKEQGKIEEAIAAYRKALSLKPDNTTALNNLGNALLDQGWIDDAVATYRRALTFKPDDADTHSNLGNALNEQGKLDEALASLRRALVCQPDHVKAHINLGNVLNGQGKLAEAIASYHAALALEPDCALAHSNLLFALQFDSAATPEELVAAGRRFAAQCETPLKAQWRVHANTREPERRLKIGYLSPDFRRHAVAFFFEPVLANHDKGQIEVCCYYNNVQHDEFTARMAAHADRWLDCKWMTDEQLAGRIRADGIDILVDLAGHTAHNRVLTLARKPAPIQMTYLGYPGTSGLTAVDYRVTDGYADPPGSEAYYTEKLVRLPDSLCCYQAGRDMPEVTALPAQQNGYVTFGSFNNFNKVSTACIELWARLLQAVPTSRLLMVTVPEGEVRRRLMEQFAALGIPAERLEFFGKLAQHEFLRTFQRADIALDPIPVTGGTTTCESLWMGLPVVVLIGKRFISRVGYSFLHAAGMDEFAAETTEDYIQVAKKLAGDVPRLAQLRAELRARVANSPLTDAATFTRNLEKIYRDAWIEWCNTAT